MARSTVKAVYDQIVKDLQEAESQFKLVSEARQWKKDYRASLPMVQLLLSRTYLYMENWEEAAKYAKMVMNDSRFKLLDLNTVETEKNEYGQVARIYTNYHSYDESSEVIFLMVKYRIGQDGLKNILRKIQRQVCLVNLISVLLMNCSTVLRMVTFVSSVIS